MKTTAVMLGKFRGPHLGHAFAIKTAIARFDNVVIVVSDDDESFISIHDRVQILRKAFPLIAVMAVDRLPNDPGELDEQGIALDKDFIKNWAYALKGYVLPYKLTHIVSSDRYGKELAEYAEVKWFPIDPDRETFNISATKIRNDNKYFSYLMPEARSALTKRIAIVGAESTGKSTMMRYMSKMYDTVGVHEWGRSLCEAKDNKLATQDFQDIMYTQARMNNIAFENASHLAFQDTDAFTTYNFLDLYTEATANYKEQLRSNANYFDKQISAYIVLAPTVPFVQEGTRTSEHIRAKMHQNILKNVIKSGKPYILIDSNSYSNRFNKAYEWVNKYYG